MISNKGLLYVEPSQAASPTPVIDDVTQKMCAAFRKARRSDGGWAGVHECMCGAHSTCWDYHLPNGDLTNSLCVHYVAHHRSEVPAKQLARINAFRFGEDKPNEQELQGPELVLAGIRASVEEYLGSDRLGTWVAWGLDVEALCRSLRGGCLAKMAGFTEARQDADALFSILCSIEEKALPRLRESVQHARGDVRSWGAEALCVPGWNREAWAMPLADLMRFADGDPIHRRVVAMSFQLLGTHAGAAITALFDLAKWARDLQYDVGLALRDIKSTPGLFVPPAAVPGLFELVQDSSYPELQISAALVLARAGLNTEHAVRALIRMALEGKEFEYAAAVLCGTRNQTEGYVGEPGIEGWGNVALPILLAALQASDWQPAFERSSSSVV